ncbi:MAG TPA: PepSY-associated TM helix domain-containing protein [Vicinamibacterales bacterium]|nr:PepSY-associated TM helix domain-containing protein [Vicinamibacterales bacterium]
MRAIVLRLHLILASIAGVFLIIVGGTGSLMAFEPELWHLTHRQLSYVTPAGTPLPLATLGEAAKRAAPGVPINGYGLSVSPDLSYQVNLRGRVAYMNQYTGEVLGVVPNGPDFLSRVHQLHLRLLWRDERDRGKTIISWSGVAMVALLASGLYLWWPLKRVSLRRGGSAYQAWFDLHNMTGVLSLAFLLVLSLTGIFIGFDDKLVPLAYRLTGSKPDLVYGQPPPLHSAANGRTMISADDAIAAARRALPGAAPISVNVPGPTGVYSIGLRYPEDLTPGGRSRVMIDPYSGDVLAAEGSRSAPAGTRLVTLNRAIHTGDLFGLASKAVMSLASLAVVGQAVSGLVIWLTRRSR